MCRRSQKSFKGYIAFRIQHSLTIISANASTPVTRSQFTTVFETYVSGMM